MRTCLLIAFITGCLLRSEKATGQYDSLPPVAAARNFMAVKAMGLPTFFWANGMVWSAGFEYGFCRRHSIGFSLAYAESGGKYSYNDSVQKSKGYPYRHSVDRGIFVYYRCYSKNWWQAGWNWLRPYAGAFTRIGNADLHFDKGYETDLLKYDERQLSAGAVIGMVWTIDAGAFCLDAHIGPFYKWKASRSEYSVQNLTMVDNRKEQGPGLKIGFTLTYLLQRGK